MVTLSLIAMSGLLLFLWWYKPLEPHGFVRIDIIRIPRPSTPDPPVGGVRAAVKMDSFREQSLGRRVKTIFKTETFFFDQDRRRPFFRALHSWLWSPLNLLEIMLNDYGALFLRLDKSIITEGSTKASTFYAPDTINNLYDFFFTLENVLGSLCNPYTSLAPSSWALTFTFNFDMNTFARYVILILTLLVSISQLRDEKQI